MRSVCWIFIGTSAYCEWDAVLLPKRLELKWRDYLDEAQQCGANEDYSKCQIAFQLFQIGFGGQVRSFRFDGRFDSGHAFFQCLIVGRHGLLLVSQSPRLFMNTVNLSNDFCAKTLAFPHRQGIRQPARGQVNHVIGFSSVIPFEYAYSFISFIESSCQFGGKSAPLAYGFMRYSKPILCLIVSFPDVIRIS